MRDEERIDAADDQLDDPAPQVQEPLVHLKDLDEVVALGDLLLHADVAAHQHQEVAAVDLAEVQVGVDDVLLHRHPAQ